MEYIRVIESILDSQNVTVGGGSASAISGAMAAGLIGMVARLSTKEDHGIEVDEFLKIAEELDILSKELLVGADQDTEAYLMIKKAFLLPKSSDVEKYIRAKAIQEAAKAAADVPHENAKRCKKVLALGKLIVDHYNKNAESDYVIGMDLASLGVRGCVLNIKANLPLIKDQETQQKYEDIIESMTNNEF
ncbi:MAG: cyclodeaminase/cyclohydrolase family protein [Bacillota bacterium]|nr:cyclodeaminase/cyclohydrolase family protein [Bacillota bacterium]